MKRPLVFMNGQYTRITTEGIKFLSLALVSDYIYGDKPTELYLEIEQPNEYVDPWVIENVMPCLSRNTVTEEEAKKLITEFITNLYGTKKPVLVSDVNQFD